MFGGFGLGQLDTVRLRQSLVRPVVHHVDKRVYPSCALEEFASAEGVSETIGGLLKDEKETEKRILMQLEYDPSYPFSTHSSEKT